MKITRRILLALTAAVICAASLGLYSAPVSASGLLGSSKKTKDAVAVTLYADFSNGSVGNEELIVTKVVNTDAKPDAFTLASLLTEWTGIDFILRSVSELNDDIHIDWDEESTLISGLDDREFNDDFVFYDAESLIWFMLDSMYLTIINNMEADYVFYSVDDGPLTWDEDEMSILTELPENTSYMGSAYYYAEADATRDDVEVIEEVDLGDENDAYYYLCAQMEDLADLGFDFEFYDEDDIDDVFCWVFDLNHEEGGYIHEIAVTADGVIHTPSIISDEFVPVGSKEYEITGMYYYNGDESGGGFEFLGDGAVTIHMDNGDTAEAEYAVYKNLLYILMPPEDEDDEVVVANLIITDENCIVSFGGETFFKEGGNWQGDITDEDSAYDYFCYDMSMLLDIGFELGFYGIEEADDETCWVFELLWKDVDDTYYIENYYAVTEDFLTYIWDFDTEEWVLLYNTVYEIGGEYYYNGDSDDSCLFLDDDGTAVLTSGDDEYSGVWAVYGELVYVKVEADDQYQVGFFMIESDDSLMIDDEDGYFRLED